MESHSDRPEITAFLELEHLVRNVGEALAGFRRRAQLAEAKYREVDGGGAVPVERVAELEAEVAELRERLDKATDRTQQMLDRVRFLRQQQLQGD